MDRAEFLKHMASLSPEEKAAYGFGPPVARANAEPHKWAAYADAVPDAQVATVVNTCREGIKAMADAPGDGEVEGKAYQALASLSSPLASAARASAIKRLKPFAFSLASICNYMQSEVFHAKREAARRKIPVSFTPPAAAVESTAGKAGAK
jgi:hypothetical protein